MGYPNPKLGTIVDAHMVRVTFCLSRAFSFYIYICRARLPLFIYPVHGDTHSEFQLPHTCILGSI